ncbi:hypothetical protein KAI19_00805 [bacterium]|nr:hypothetical protein [bacterium]
MNNESLSHPAKPQEVPPIKELLEINELPKRSRPAIKGTDIVCSSPKKATKIAMVVVASIIYLVFIIAVFPKKPYESPLLKEANALRTKLETEIRGKPNAADDYLKAKDVYVDFSSAFSLTKDRSG